MFTRNLITLGVSALFLVGAALLLHPASARAALYDASGVLGQPDFTSSVATTTKNGLNYPFGAALDAENHRLFVSDCPDHRELVFQLDVYNNITTTSAAYVLGQPDFTTNIATTTQSRMGCTSGAAYDASNNRLFVADGGNNNRIMVFDVATSTIANGENASFVLGQPDFTSSTHQATQSGLWYPGGLQYDASNNRLFVLDGQNHRIMVFNVATSTIANGENASSVLGQPSFTSNIATTTQSGLFYPNGLALDSNTSRIFIGDSDNNRIMVFDVATSSMTNGENAENVLGQPDFTSAGFQTTQRGFNTPDGLALDPTFNRLFVSDDNNNRIMVFDVATSSITNGENAENVLGQPDFTSGGFQTTQRGFNDPEGDIAYDPVSHILFVPDSSNSRVLQFNFISITNGSPPNGAVGTSYSQTISTQNSQGTVSFAVQSGALPSGLSLNSSTGVISGTPTVAGISSFTIEADDGFSTGNFFDRKDYTITVAAAPAPAPTPTPTPVSGGGGLPPVAYMPPVAPAGGFQIAINNGAAITDNPAVTLALTAGPDIKRMAVSNTADFTGVGQEPFSNSTSWNLCWINPALTRPADCASGTKTVYVKFYTDWGQASPVISANIQYQSGGNAPALSAPSTQSGSAGLTFASGSLVNDHGTIYLIDGTTKIGFTSLAAFRGLGYKTIERCCWRYLGVWGCSLYPQRCPHGPPRWFLAALQEDGLLRNGPGHGPGPVLDNPTEQRRPSQVHLADERSRLERLACASCAASDDRE